METLHKKYDVIGLGSCTMDLIFAVDDIMLMPAWFKVNCFLLGGMPSPVFG